MYIQLVFEFSTATANELCTFLVSCLVVRLDLSSNWARESIIGDKVKMFTCQFTMSLQLLSANLPRVHVTTQVPTQLGKSLRYPSNSGMNSKHPWALARDSIAIMLTRASGKID